MLVQFPDFYRHAYIKKIFTTFLPLSERFLHHKQPVNRPLYFSPDSKRKCSRPKSFTVKDVGVFCYFVHVRIYRRLKIYIIVATQNTFPHDSHINCSYFPHEM